MKNSGLGKIPGTADQVILGDVDRSRSHKVDVVFIIGLNDGQFPSVNKNEGFFDDKDREILKENGIELAKGTIEKLYEDNFNIYKAFTVSEEKLFLSYSSADMQGKALRPSMLINRIKNIYKNIDEKSDVLENKTEILNINSTYEELSQNISKLKEQLKNMNIPEQIKKENIDKLYGNTLVTSISKLERYRSCPFSYYLQYSLFLFFLVYLYSLALLDFVLVFYSIQCLFYNNQIYNTRFCLCFLVLLIYLYCLLILHMLFFYLILRLCYLLYRFLLQS